MRERISIDADWRFRLIDDDAVKQPAYDDSEWRRVDLPHDWSIESAPQPENPAGAGGGFFPGGLAWYRKVLPVQADLGEQRLLIEFDGVYMNSEVWCNGNFCGLRPYGYSSFCYDLTPHVTPGQDAVIAVRVDNSRQRNSRWYSGSGIYRHVWLTRAAPLRVGHWGTYLRTPRVDADSADVAVSTTLRNDTATETAASLQWRLLDPTGHAVAAASAAGTVPPCGEATLDGEMTVSRPALWSPESPWLYQLETTVLVNGRSVDRTLTTCGIRSIRFDANAGFFLNGENVKLKGVNEHHDAGCLGAAVPDDVIRHRFSILKAMGCNAIRVAHNPASPSFLALCDEMGFMVVEDAFDEWRAGKTDFGYQLYWDAWWARDLTDMIRRDRNHPCLIMWSVGNEIIEMREGRPEGLPMMAALRDLCHREDPTRPMTCGCCRIRDVNAAGYGPLMDVVGYNGGGGSCFDYAKDHAAYPDRVIFASEVPHSLQTRGVYRTQTWYRDLARNPDVERLDVPHLTEDEVFTDFDEHYQSSYDNAMVRISSIDSWRLTSTLPFMCGEFRWTGFDYLGECYRWPAKSWNFGVIDLCGFPKDTYYFYQSQWTTEPMVHLLPHWTWPGLEGRTIPVVAYSNCDEVELYLDGESLGVMPMDPERLHVRFDVPYRAGELRAVARRDGEEVASCEQVTAGAPAALRLSSEQPRLRADGTGVAHVAIDVVDAAGRLAPHAGPLLTVRVSGAGCLRGLENGDPIDGTHYQSGGRRAFHGRAMALVQAGREPGPITITVEAEGLPEATLKLEAL